MSTPILFSGIPSRISSLERFGVGDFSARQRYNKCTLIKDLMQKREPVPEHPLLSVIVPMHREERYMLATLRSLAEQKTRNAEFIVVVNGEPKGCLTERIARDSGFRVLHERRAGVALARQRGLLEARGDIIVTTDGDTLHPPLWLTAIEKEWRRQQEYVAGFGWVHALSSSFTQNLWTETQNVWRSVQGRYFFFSASEANSWYLRDAALAVGGYDTSCNYFEGSILFRKILTLGKLCCCQQDDATVYTSDRRTLTNRMQAVAQYLTSFNAEKVEYDVVR